MSSSIEISFKRPPMVSFAGILIAALVYDGFTKQILLRAAAGNCGKPKSNKLFVHCRDGYYATSTDTCDKVSLPQTITYKILRFDKSKKRFDVNVTWSTPLYGFKSLWGYEVSYNLYKPGHFSLNSCVQMLFKRRWYVLKNLFPGSRYHVVVLSLPRHNYKVSGLKGVFIKLPDLCDTEKQHNLTMSFKCWSVTHFKVQHQCHKETAKVTWNKPQYDDFNHYLLEWRPEKTFHWNYTLLLKNITEYYIRGLKKGTTYELQVVLEKNRRLGESGRRLKYFCSESISSQPKRKPETVIIIAISLSSVFGLLMIAVGYVMRYRQKMWNKFFIDKLPPCPSLSPPSSPSEHPGPSVLVFHLPGCKYVEYVAIYFVQLLREAGVNAVSYEQETIQVHQLTSAAYLDKRLKEVDYTITFYSEPNEDNDDQTSDLFKQAAIICSNECNNPESGKKHISCYFHLRLGPRIFGNYLAKTLNHVPATLRHRCYKFPKEIDKIVGRLIAPDLKVNWTQFELDLNDKLLEAIYHLSYAILNSTHEHCYSDECRRGKKVWQLEPRTPAISSSSTGSSINGDLEEEENPTMPVQFRLTRLSRSISQTSGGMSVAADNKEAITVSRSNPSKPSYNRLLSESSVQSFRTDDRFKQFPNTSENGQMRKENLSESKDLSADDSSDCNSSSLACDGVLSTEDYFKNKRGKKELSVTFHPNENAFVTSLHSTHAFNGVHPEHPKHFPPETKSTTEDNQRRSSSQSNSSDESSPLSAFNRLSSESSGYHSESILENRPLLTFTHAAPASSKYQRNLSVSSDEAAPTMPYRRLLSNCSEESSYSLCMNDKSHNPVNFNRNISQISDETAPLVLRPSELQSTNQSMNKLEFEGQHDDRLSKNYETNLSQCDDVTTLLV